MAALVEYLGGLRPIAGGKPKGPGSHTGNLPRQELQMRVALQRYQRSPIKGAFDNDGTAVNYWSVDYISGAGGRLWILDNNSGQITQSYSKYSDDAYTVRCIKDK